MKLSEVIAATEVYEDGCSPVVWGLLREFMDPEVVAQLSVPGEPASKARPRFNGQGAKNRAHNPAKTREAEEIIGWHFRRACPGWRGPDADGTFGVLAKFFAGNHQRRDLDNMLKLLLDACNNLIWVDDSQVAEVSGRVIRGSAHPSTEVIIYHLPHVTGEHGTPTRTLNCEFCGTAFRSYASWSNRKFCSKSCSAKARWLPRTKQCPQCGKEFREGPSKPREFCSAGCRSRGTLISITCTGCGVDFMRPRSMVRLHANAFCNTACQQRYWQRRRPILAAGMCLVCGKPTSKKTYNRCNACRVAGIPVSHS